MENNILELEEFLNDEKNKDYYNYFGGYNDDNGNYIDVSRKLNTDKHYKYIDKLKSYISIKFNVDKNDIVLIVKEVDFLYKQDKTLIANHKSDMYNHFNESCLCRDFILRIEKEYHHGCIDLYVECNYIGYEYDYFIFINPVNVSENVEEECNIALSKMYDYMYAYRYDSLKPF